MRDTSQHRQNHTKAVIQRYRNAQSIRLGELHSLPRKVTIVEDIAVGEGRSLRVSRGATGKLDVNGIVGLQLASQCSQLVAVLLPAQPTDSFKI